LYDRWRLAAVITMRATLRQIALQEDVNFLLTNRIPRRLATRFIGWFSRIEHPLVRDLSLGAWRMFSDLDLSDARDTGFRSLHDCFTRRLKDGARPVDADPQALVSPCDAIVGATGSVRGGEALQIKGFPYRLHDLLCDDALAEIYCGGNYITLRLTSAMYHHFHAPHDCRVESVTYISGDTWNVNPIALRRIENLFCKNERAVIRTRLDLNGHCVTLVAVAAVLVAGIRLTFLDTLCPPHAGAPRVVPCDAALSKGEEMGWFEHGSTIVMFVPPGFGLDDRLSEGGHVRAGEALMRMPAR
jgi:phosphatidylserine decarboxylase